MKILSNFDTNLEKELLKEYQKQYGKENVLSIRKSDLFFWKYVGLPVFVYIALLIVAIGVIFVYDNLDPLIPWVVAGIFLLYALMLLFKVGDKWVDYKMDFLIVTPKEISKYNQSGMFEKHIEQLHADKIKSISLSKSGLLNSILDIGSIVFLAEGNNDKGDIIMEYVDAVEAQERKIGKILGM